MTYLQNIYYVLLVLINGGAIVRIIFCFIKMMANEGAENSMSTRIKNAMYFTIIADCSLGVSTAIISYFTGKISIFHW
ncbi:MAG: hypothetical protein RR219_09610 [Clostridiales bacterium]